LRDKTLSPAEFLKAVKEKDLRSFMRKRIGV
jgi:hypothetical protein